MLCVLRGYLRTKHYTTYYRFFSNARWSLDKLGLALFELIVKLLGLTEVELVLDDTLSHRTGKKLALATMHADPLLKTTSRGRLFTSYGHVFVVLAVHVKVSILGKTGWGSTSDVPLVRGPVARRSRRRSVRPAPPSRAS